MNCVFLLNILHFYFCGYFLMNNFNHKVLVNEFYPIPPQSFSIWEDSYSFYLSFD